ncbi:MAG: DUF433 domain-containing protein [Microcystis novacekii Mn_MB_F_20050700_S1D]|uniref:DUF433 domain-containing protein n=1 Tax=Microcystis novacekii Mn_MB_F_20050700_S1D TaxID=2486266 RepID=A0A552IWG2_9CHRO|nr:MAG: DUF433 domain-containing protein [Microcystis novacekii Mn_MB_F_20050700_S1D]
MTARLIKLEYISIDPQIRFGKPCISGTRVAVEDIAIMYLKLGDSLEEIAQEYNLSLASVYAAIAYYYDNQEEIDRRREEGKAYAEKFREKNLSLLQEKMRHLKSESKD